jgi:metal-responsive CopG/Arc/MetJ family transcriptional regulator
MGAVAMTAQKVTITMAAELLAYADREARRLQISRSQFIGEAVAAQKASEEAALAAEGYAFYAAEAAEFADASSEANAEAWGHDS